MCRVSFVSTSWRDNISWTINIIGSFWSHLLRGLLGFPWSDFTTLCQDAFSPALSLDSLLAALGEQDTQSCSYQTHNPVHLWSFAEDCILGGRAAPTLQGGLLTRKTILSAARLSFAASPSLCWGSAQGLPTMQGAKHFGLHPFGF